MGVEGDIRSAYLVPPSSNIEASIRSFEGNCRGFNANTGDVTQLETKDLASEKIVLRAAPKCHPRGNELIDRHYLRCDVDYVLPDIYPGHCVAIVHKGTQELAVGGRNGFSGGILRVPSSSGACRSIAVGDQSVTGAILTAMCGSGSNDFAYYTLSKDSLPWVSTAQASDPKSMVGAWKCRIEDKEVGLISTTPTIQLLPQGRLKVEEQTREGVRDVFWNTAKEGIWKAEGGNQIAVEHPRSPYLFQGTLDAAGIRFEGVQRDSVNDPDPNAKVRPTSNVTGRVLCIRVAS
jgi:hypothetical protein